ncbi:unnamed protein product [Blepharisma stoltei]|uniref:C2HC/C3H-type domain-containing protein n=1 Tax=Blepharisma stoltei TaxID=1481888 RepID=A0AAU9JJM1_9CILI|nr:unnamed protein product [Blepharisma stoltei]
MMERSGQRFGSSKPVSEQELMQARHCLRLLKDKIARNPPAYFRENGEEPEQVQPAASNYRKAFKPVTNNQEAPISRPPIYQETPPPRAPMKKPQNVAKESSKGFAQYDFESVEGAEQPGQEDRVSCPDCGRKFAPESFEKHSRICKKVFMSKRKEFNSSEQRAADEAAEVPKKSAPPPRKPAASGKNNKWKMQSEQLRANMKAARLAGSGNDSAAYEEAARAAAELNQDQYTKCPHCGRSFNEDAANRHIPICAKKAMTEQFKKGGKQPPPRAGKR